MLKQIIISMRPKQWSKNLFVLAAIIFTGNVTDLSLLVRSLLGFIVFCGLSGVVYIINDIIDKEADRKHPRKKDRPIASGELQQAVGLAAAISVGSISLGFSLLLPPNFVFCALVYLSLLIAYSLFLKSLVIIDAIVVSLGFVLRLLAGGFAISIASTPWSLIMTFFLAIFIALVKRKGEREALGDEAFYYREYMHYYTKESLDYMIIISATSVIISYTLFAFFSGKNVNLYMTVPFVVYGVFRYMYLAFEKDLGADPAILFIQDRPLFFNIVTWAVASAIIIYFL